MARKIDPEKRSAILQAARKLFKEQGFDNTTIAEIAKEAGIANGTVYLYFKSKIEIARALADFFFAERMKVVGPYLDNPDIKKAVAGSIHAALIFSSKNPDLVQLIDVQRCYGDHTNRPKSDIESDRTLKLWIKQQQARGYLTQYHPATLAELVAGLLQWVSKICFIWSYTGPERYEKAMVDLITDAILHGRKASPGARKNPY